MRGDLSVEVLDICREARRPKSRKVHSPVDLVNVRTTPGAGGRPHHEPRQHLEAAPVRLDPEVGVRSPERVADGRESSPYGRRARIRRPCHRACFSVYRWAASSTCWRGATATASGAFTGWMRLVVATGMGVVIALVTACGAVSHGPAATGTPSPPPRAASPQPSPGVPLCNPAAADYRKAGAPTPSPCVSFDPDQQMRQNLAYLDRRSPSATDAAALAPAVSALQRVFDDLRASGQYDLAAVQHAVAARPELQTARVHPPLSERLPTRDARVVVVLAHGTACLFGVHGPSASPVAVVGLTLDGGCEAIYGH